MDRRYTLVLPPHFNGTNYAYWKVQMISFLKSIDERVQHTISKGQTNYTIDEDAWTDAQLAAANYNHKALNAIFNVVSKDEFRRVSTVNLDLMI